jgi:hypothetical protein
MTRPAGATNTTRAFNHINRRRVGMAQKSICAVDGCDKVSLKRGYCGAHYSRWWNYGDPLAGKAAKTASGEAQRWLLNHVGHAGDECLIWPFSRALNGRGKIEVNGRVHNAARRMCELAYGPAPSQQHDAAHSCGKGHEACVNPRHLRWLTKSENQADCIVHGTRARCALTEDDVRDIRLIGAALSQRALAKRYGVDHRTIGDILRRKTWTWIK